MARLLGLPFPGGPHIDRVAREGHVTIDFPRGLTSRRDLERHRFDFSFSGLKTAVARWVEARQASGEAVPVADVAASFQEAVCDVLVRKALDAATDRGIEDILIGGGVAANSRLRAMATERAADRGIRVRVPRPGLCTDNGAMVAALGSELVARGRPRLRPRPPRRLLHARHHDRRLNTDSSAVSCGFPRSAPQTNRCADITGEVIRDIEGHRGPLRTGPTRRTGPYRRQEARPYP